jgi:hypothetical protein
MKRIGFFVAFGSFVLLPLLLFAQDKIKEMSVNWRHKDGDTLFQFEKVRRYREKLFFDFVIHNTNKTDSQCFFITWGDKITLLDDNVGRGYAGSQVVLKTKETSKLAPNESEAASIMIRIPEAGLREVSLHLGLFAKKAEAKQDCPNPLVDMGINFHKRKIDLQPLL